MFESDRLLLTCGADVGGQAATCTARGTSCSCELTVTPGIPEGTAPVLLTGRSVDGTGGAVTTVQIDRTGPLSIGSLVTLVRNPLGTDDGLIAAPGAFSDDADPQHSYPGRGIREVRVYGSSDTPIATIPLLPGTDGSFFEQPLPGTDGLTPSTLAPEVVWVRAVDLLGNLGSPSEVTSGRDHEAPIVDGNLVAIHRRDSTQQDGIDGAPGTIAELVSAVREVVVWDAAVGGNPVGTAMPAADGSFPEILVGTPTASFGRLWVETSDKCGLTSTRGEAEIGRDVDPPLVDGSLITVFARPAGGADGVSAGAGAISAAESVVELGVFADDAAASLLASFAPALDGSFGEQPIGDTGLNRVHIVARDKAGNRSAPSASGVLELTANLAGRVPHDDRTGPLALLSLAADADPRMGYPELFTSLGVEATAQGSAAGSAVDAARTVVTATPAVGGESPSWQLRPPPYEREQAAMAFDSRRGKIVVFGGDGSFAPGDTWEFDGTEWSQVVLRSAPSARKSHAMAYDSARGVVVLFGGRDDSWTLLGDTWEYDGVAWTEVPQLVAPSPRHGHALVYDEARGRMVLSGGASDSHVSAETWEYDGTQWTRAAAGPSRWVHALAYDSARGRVVLFGGESGFGSLNSMPVSDETWEYDGAAWVRIPLAVSPSRRFAHCLTFDLVRQKVVLFGGHSGSPFPDPLDDTWEYDGAAWTQRAPLTTPSARMRYSAAYDSVRGQTVMFGGVLTYDRVVNETWEYDGTDWREVLGTPPHDRRWAALAYDSARGKAVLFGGEIQGEAPPLNDTWEYDGTRWAQVQLASPPSGRIGHELVYDSIRQKTVLFGGSPGRLNDTWEYDGSGWAQVLVPGAPPGRGWSASAFDAARGRMVLFGGLAGGALDDTWEYDGVTWSQVAIPGPPARWDHALVHDAARQRLVLFGGYGGSTLGDTWEYDGSSWTEVVIAAPPPARWDHQLAYDPDRQKVVLWGGANDQGRLQDLWEYDGASWTQVPLASAPPARASAGMVYQTNRRRLLLYVDDTTRLGGETWEYVPDLPHARTAAHSIRVTPGLPGSVTWLSATYVGAGLGDLGGASTPGVELLIWDWSAAGFTSLGSHAAADGDSASARTISAVPPGNLDAYYDGGAFWLLAVPEHPSSRPPGVVASELSTDYVELRARILLQ